MAEVKVTTNKQMALAVHGDVGVIVMSAREISDEMWSEYIALQSALVAVHGTPTYILNVSPYVGPSAKQRQQLKDSELKLHEIKFVALITDSVVVRGAITALGWLVRSVTTRAFAKASDGVEFLLERGCKTSREELAALVKQVSAEIGYNGN